MAVCCTLRHAKGEDFWHGSGRDACFELRQLVNSRPIPLPCALLPGMHGRHPGVGPLVRLRQPLPSGRQACKAGNKPGRNLRGNRRGHGPRAEGRPLTAPPIPGRVVQSGPVWALKVPVLRGSGLRAVGLATAAFPWRRGGHGDFPSRGINKCINKFEDSSLTHEPNPSPPKRIRRVGGGLRPLEGIQLPAFGGLGVFAGSLSSFIRLMAVPQGVPDAVCQDLPWCLVLVALHVRSGYLLHVLLRGLRSLLHPPGQSFTAAELRQGLRGEPWRLGRGQFRLLEPSAKALQLRCLLPDQGLQVGIRLRRRDGPTDGSTPRLSESFGGLADLLGVKRFMAQKTESKNTLPERGRGRGKPTVTSTVRLNRPPLFPHPN